MTEHSIQIHRVTDLGIIQQIGRLRADVWLDQLYYYEGTTQYGALQQGEVVGSAQQNETFMLWVVADQDGDTPGWKSLLPFRSNPVLRPLMAESSTYVRRHARLLNLAGLLLARAIEHAEHSYIKLIVAFVADSDKASLRLAQKFEFVRLGSLAPTMKPPHRGSESLFIRQIIGCERDVMTGSR